MDYHQSSRSCQNHCHVCCSHLRGLGFRVEVGRQMRFNCIKFILQSSLVTVVQTWFSADHMKFHPLFLQFYQISMDSFQINWTASFVCATSTYSEMPEGMCSQERKIFRLIQKPTHFQNQHQG